MFRYVFYYGPVYLKLQSPHLLQTSQYGPRGYLGKPYLQFLFSLDLQVVKHIRQLEK